MQGESSVHWTARSAFKTNQTAFTLHITIKRIFFYHARLVQKRHITQPNLTAELRRPQEEPHTHIGKKWKPMNWFSHAYHGQAPVMASGIARRRVRTTAAAEWCKMVAVLQLISWWRHAALVYSALICYCRILKATVPRKEAPFWRGHLKTNSAECRWSSLSAWPSNLKNCYFISNLRAVPTKYKGFCAWLGPCGKSWSLQGLLESEKLG